MSHSPFLICNSTAAQSTEAHREAIQSPFAASSTRAARAVPGCAQRDGVHASHTRRASNQRFADRARGAETFERNLRDALRGEVGPIVHGVRRAARARTRAERFAHLRVPPKALRRKA